MAPMSSSIESPRRFFGYSLKLKKRTFEPGDLLHDTINFGLCTGITSGNG